MNESVAAKSSSIASKNGKPTRRQMTQNTERFDKTKK
jgi:hypothetical protein